MAVLEKHIFQTWANLQNYLISKGFTIANNKIIYNLVPNDTRCYWSYDNVGTVNFVTSTNENAFYHNLTDFTNGKYCGCVWIPLKDNGFILFLSPVDPSFNIVNLTLCCTNNYHDDEGTWVDDDNDLDNGIIICTPAEEDNYWRFTWRDKNPQYYKWDIDNTQNIVTVGTEIPSVKMIQAPLTVTLLKAYLANGYWSNYIYVQVLGQIDPPGDIFKINGQKFISISDNNIYRCPVFKLPPEGEIVNPSTSTEEYSPDKTYKVGDYCIFEGLLWKCIYAITTPMAFDQSYWEITTVSNELQNN